MKGTFGDFLVQTPPQGRANFQVRLGCFRASSRRVLKTSVDGGPSLSNLSQCLTSLPVKSCLLTSSGSFLHCHSWPLSPALLLCPSQESLALAPLLLLQPAPCGAFSLVSWQNRSSSISVASHSTLCIFLTSLLFWTTANWSQLSCCNGTGESPTLTCRLCPAIRKPSLLQGRPAASPVIHCPPAPHVLFCGTTGSRAVALHWVMPNQVQDFC